ncbi:prophage tail fiber N-terminal domain-containing protein [Salmonella enterica subsp. enterica serovar Derby]|uniref:M14 carboxypeptidase N/E family protein n=1 Tax=Salmonella enterica TaxID=28901 RepID=UPI001300A950|nr:M14 carboxypeptidase N/E family protein [Salmonella enterica]EHJ5082133.1 prophage tail fiber N-terminal domain-containing protein [Salmonella enterica subsp. enterica serovar 47:z4,z23:-]EDH5878160.1 hypothetical protein [Salmonella enterica subsp. enterica serovar Derby]EDJ6908490.1 hypothetical protein [Salmonella enterica subsp. enterica serovar Derby]EDL0965096.1 hypothetical protein [Salmonella enterica subsp. enterica serovar Derby]EDL6554293.1 hypothetical protein [Salmonella enteri
MTVIKGTITDATGQPLAGATITFTALQNTVGMLRSVATYITTVRGEYEFTVTPGVYSVSLAQNGTNGYALGSVHIYDDSPDGTLNSFLNTKNIDTRPEALRQFEALAQQTKADADKAAKVLEDAINASIKGEKGDTGEPGPQGLQGPPGPQGLKGDKGDQGDGITTVKTDGITLTGDGNTIPLSVVINTGGEIRVGDYVIAYLNDPMNSDGGIQFYGHVVAGSNLITGGFWSGNSPATSPPTDNHLYFSTRATVRLLGTYKCCGYQFGYSLGLFMRIR